MILPMPPVCAFDGGCISLETSNGELVASTDGVIIDPKGKTGDGAIVDPKGITAGESVTMVVSVLFRIQPVFKPGTMMQTTITQLTLFHFIYDKALNYKK